MALNFKISKIGPFPCLEVTGRVIDSDSERFAKKIETLCTSGSPKVVVDCTNVDFLDSFGLGILVRYHNILLKEGREMVFLYQDPNPHSFIWRLFDITGLRSVLRIIDSPDQV